MPLFTNTLFLWGIMLGFKNTSTYIAAIGGPEVVRDGDLGLMGIEFQFRKEKTVRLMMVRAAQPCECTQLLNCTVKYS